MKKILIAGFCGLAFAAAVMFVTARSSVGEQPGAAKPVAIEVATTTVTPAAEPAAPKSAAAEPAITQHASAASRHAGKAVAAMPAAAIVFFAPRYGSGPRIIHVTQPDERAEISAGDDGDAAATIDDLGNDVVPRRPAAGPRTHKRK